ncbi:hypothetical protein BH10PAT4_BH10PAT4_1050 [soil metagenome]
MKKPKTKKLTKQRSRIRSISRRTISPIKTSKPVIKHLRLVSHEHTGKLIHLKHTSHLALLGMLVIVGFFLIISQNFVKASGNVQVGLVVNGPPPTVGSTITSPINGFNIVNINPTPISGSCAADTFVVIYNDGSLSSSTICQPNGTFSVNVQLHEGTNVLSAKNFDNLNQPGPTTPTVTVTFSSVQSVADVPQPVLPENPVIIPGVTEGISECADYTPPANLPVGGQPRVAVVCVPRSIEKNAEHRIGVLVWGGTPPYAVNVAWGSGQSTLVSLDAPGYKTFKVSYASSGIYNINIQVTDRGSSSTTGESAIQVTDPNAGGPQTIGQFVDDVFTTSWFQTPVPLYVTAVGLTLGFWGGDIFNRHFGAKKLHKRSTRRA